MNNFDDIYANNVSSQKILSTHYNSFYFDVLNGLSKKNKKIPYKYLYDKNGEKLSDSDESKIEKYFFKLTKKKNNDKR